MNSTPAPRVPSRWLRLLRWFAIAMGASVLVLAFAAFSLVRLTRDASNLRDSVVATLDHRPATQVQVTAGPATLAAARLVLHFIDNVPPEAHSALAAVRSASVGVYEVGSNPGAVARHQMMARTDAAMQRRGWDRIVAVNQPDSTVLIYMPAGTRATGTQRFCLSVCDHDKLVVVSGAADTEALAALIRSQHKLAFR